MEMDEPFKIYSGDCLKSMKKLESNSVDSIVTDPPYGLSFMGKEWDYDVPKKKVWKEALRVLKPGGHLVAFFGSRTYHRGCVAIEDAGFEIRDQIMWVYGSGFPKSYNIGKAYDAKVKTGDSSPTGMRKAAMGDDYKETDGAGTEDYGNKGNLFGTSSMDKEYNQIGQDNSFTGWGTALKPSHEPIVLARKPFGIKVEQYTDKNGKVKTRTKQMNTLDNAIEYGTGGINIDACRVGTETIKSNGYASGMKDGVSENGVLGTFNENHEPTYNEGRFPANLIHDGSDEVVELFPDTGSQKLKENTINKDEPRGKDGTWNESNSDFKNTQEAPRIYDGSGSAARFFYCAKVGKKERNEGINLTANKNNHPTVKPKALMVYLCKLITPEGGIILDPFMGSGSTGKAAVSEGFRFIGCEMDKDYIKIAKERIQWEIDNE